jgi:DNA-binding LacI/PurR family transcriptional regulator
VIKKTTIVDIAKVAGVSVSTVSRILNNKPDVAEETRQRVLQVMEDQRFAPHSAWQQLRSGRSRVIALHFPQDFNPLSQGIITNAALRCEQLGFTLNLIVGALSENELLGIFRSGQADGMILVEMLVNDWRVELLRQHTTNFVMIGRCTDTTGLSFVDSDIEAGVSDAIGHLVQLGHQHIGFITMGRMTPEKAYGFTTWARRGYKAACRQHGISDYGYITDLSTESVAAGAQELLDQHPQITALVTPQDAAVPGILKAVMAKGLRIPEDISLVGLLDESFAEVMTPPLTALSFSSRMLGFTAAELLVARLHGAQLNTQQILVRPELCIRGSTAPART